MSENLTIIKYLVGQLIDYNGHQQIIHSLPGDLLVREVWDRGLQEDFQVDQTTIDDFTDTELLEELKNRNINAVDHDAVFAVIELIKANDIQAAIDKLKYELLDQRYSHLV